MISKKVMRYYAECGKAFWKKQRALNHEKVCTCWVNPKFKTCLSCKHHKQYYDESTPDYPGQGYINECGIGIDQNGPAWNPCDENKAPDINYMCQWWVSNQ